jgi:hypothetical protein
MGNSSFCKFGWELRESGKTITLFAAPVPCRRSKAGFPKGGTSGSGGERRLESFAVQIGSRVLYAAAGPHRLLAAAGIGARLPQVAENAGTAVKEGGFSRP